MGIFKCQFSEYKFSLKNEAYSYNKLCTFVNMKLKIFRILLLLLCFSSLLKAQDRSSIDSLKMAISNSETDTLKISLLNDLAGIYFQINQDSSYYFLDKALKIARQIDAPIHKARTFSKIGAYYYYKEEYLKALEYIDLAFNIAGEYNDLYLILII